MPLKDGIPMSGFKGRNTVQNPAGIGIGMETDRMNPVVPNSGTGGPAWRQGGKRLGDAPVPPSVVKMNPVTPVGPGGPSWNQAGHRIGQVKEITPQTRFKPQG